MSILSRYFRFEEHGTNLRTEILAGVTTFATMAYIIIVNPKILEAAGIPFGPSMVATILSAAFGTLLMGVYARRPFAVAPYMGENAFIAYTVVGILGFSWQTALGAIFLSGVLFTLITVFGLRKWLAESIPGPLRMAFTVGIGLFLTFIGLNQTGIVALGVPGAPVHVGDFTDPSVILAILGFVIICVLLMRGCNASILIGILVISVLAFILGVAPAPEAVFSAPPSVMPILFEFDLAGALTWGFFSVVLTVFVMDFVDTLGTLLGVARSAELLDEDGNLPDIEKPMMADALATVFAACVGTSTAGTFVESATGVKAGGRTGMTSVVTAILFLLALFFSPFFTAIPAFAYGPSLIVVGLLMVGSITGLNFERLDDAVPVFTTIILMSFTYNIGIGITAGFILYPLFKVLSGKMSEVNGGMWVLAAMSILFYIFYPY